MDPRGDHDPGPAPPARGAPAAPRGSVPAGRFLLALALAWLGVDGLAGLLAGLPPEAGEAWILRWLRMVVDHPTRSKLAFLALGWGLLPEIPPTGAGARDGRRHPWNGRTPLL